MQLRSEVTWSAPQVVFRSGSLMDPAQTQSCHVQEMLCTYFGPSVNNIDEITAWIGFSDGLEHLFILKASSTKAR